MSDLDRLLAKLGDQPADRELSDLATRVDARIDPANRTSAAETWGLRAATVALVAAAGGLMASATAAATPNASPFDAWSRLAPSTLLESGG
jgi:hypothetical protein